MSNTTKLFIGLALGAGAIYAYNLYNWGQKIGSNVMLKFKSIKKFKLTGELLKPKTWEVEFYLSVLVENKNDFPITFYNLTGEIFYGSTKVANLENKGEATDFNTGKLVYDIKVTEKVLSEAKAIVSIVTSGDAIRKLRTKGEYSVDIQDKKFTLSFDEVLSIEDF